MREFLESDYVDENISKWIDFTFGYQQRGKEAEKISNVYPALCYTPEKLLNQITDIETRNSYKMQAACLGQIPQQLFNKMHPSRVIKNRTQTVCDKNIVLKVFSQSIFPDEGKIKWLKNSIIYIKTIGEALSRTHFFLITLGGTLIEGSLNEIAHSLLEYASKSKEMDGKIVSAEIKTNIKTYNSNFLSTDIWKELEPGIVGNYPILIMRRETIYIIIQGGDKYGNILMTSLTTETKQSTIKISKFPVISLACGYSIPILIAGTTIGECFIIEIKEYNKILIKNELWDHKMRLNSIYVSEKMSMFATAGDDGCINLYNYSFKPKLLRTIYHPHMVS